MTEPKLIKNKNGVRAFRFRVRINGIEYTKTWPGKHEEQIPDTWSDKRAITAARKAAALFEEECKRGLVTKDKRQLADYCQYIIDLKKDTGVLKPRTIDGYNNLMQRIKKSRLGRMRLADISARDINAFYKELSAPGVNLNTGGKLSAATVKRYHELIRSCLDHAVKEGILIINPAASATAPRIEKKEAAYFTPEQIKKIINALEDEPLFWRALTFVFIGSGARRGEIIGLKWADIDFINARINIHRNITRTQNGQLVEGSTKTGRGRVITVPDDVINMLRSWRQLQADIIGALSINGYCFAQDDYKKPVAPDTVTRWFCRFSERHGLPHINPHAFRHTQASIILRSGDIVAASSRLGHSRASTTTDIYGHLLNATDKETAAVIGAAFFKKTANK